METEPTSLPSNVEGARTSRRGLLLSVLGLAFSGLLLLVAARMPQREVPSDAEANANLIRAMGWLLLAAEAALFATSGWVRRIVGVVICVAALTTAANLGGSMSSGDQGWGLWMAAGWTASVVALATGVAVVAYGGRWPGWSRRFEPNRDRRPTDPLDQWRALDRGEDPTR